MKKIFVLLSCFALPLLAQSAGTNGLAFLKNGFGARNIAMGDLGVISANDLSALNYNPALLGVANRPQIAFSHQSLFQDLSSEVFGASVNLYGLPLAFGVNTTSISNIEIRTRPGEAEGTFNANYFFGSVSTAIKLTNLVSDQFYVGATFKYLYENLYSDEANGYGLDFGVVYKDIFDGLSFGASIKNIGSMNALRNVSTELPNDLRTGVSYEMNFNHFTVNTTAGYQTYLQEDDSHVHTGAEVVYNQSFALRIGYASGYETKGLSTGFGIVWKNLNMDYAYVPIQYGLGDSHIITLTYSFN
jgi:hypothetical protein